MEYTLFEVTITRLKFLHQIDQSLNKSDKKCKN